MNEVYGLFSINGTLQGYTFSPDYTQVIFGVVKSHFEVVHPSMLQFYVIFYYCQADVLILLTSTVVTYISVFVNCHF